MFCDINPKNKHTAISVYEKKKQAFDGKREMDNMRKLYDLYTQKRKSYETKNVLADTSF